MMTIKQSTNPYVIGIRPKRFLSARIEMKNQTIRMKDVRTFNPDWAK